MGIASHGLSTLMEAINQSQRAEDSSNEQLAMFEEAIDDDIIDALTGDDNDTVDDDMEGDGVGDEAEMEKLLAKIPPSDEMAEDEVENLTESFIPEGI
jgi:hypothetical protein